MVELRQMDKLMVAELDRLKESGLRRMRGGEEGEEP